ncbi:hypothetical protein QVD17_02761 [Tagetes erecta]|uniref:Proline-rich protein PRCC n=1 Tax=Tagetes erecta TaxID=13708 RepID=A0AAD8LEI6_TARER|nr:hypothetical protein QVD17_02761 [Tagetes erecta]
MDSLLATYASSDEEDDQQQPPVQHQSNNSSQPASKFGGNFLSSLPPPKSQPSSDSPSSSLFSKLPQPKSETSDPFSNPKPKKVVQFRPPVIIKPVADDDDDEDDDDDKKEETKRDSYVPQAPSVKSFLSSIPAPRNSGSLGALPSASGVGRRSVLEAEVSGLSNVEKDIVNVNKSDDKQVKYDHSYNEYVNVNANASAAVTSAEYVSYDYSGYGAYQNVETDGSSYGPAAPASVDYGSYEGYSGYENYGSYESKWIDRSGGNLEPAVPMEANVQSVARSHGKRGRNEIPDEVIEVSQDELMKNRPREDQVKLTGIAFGPSYQPTASSTKGKPSKLHKRKHQIGSLYFDMRSKEAELAERRSRGFLTKAETHAKYGW